MSWRRIQAIAFKDIADAVKNLYILFALILPVGMSLLLGTLFGNQEQALTMTVAVHDPGQSALVAALRAQPGVKLVDVAAAEDLAAAVGKAAGGVAVPAGFDAAAAAGQQPELAVYLNRRHGGGELAAFQLMIQQQVWALVDQPAPARVTFTDVGSPISGTMSTGFRLDQYLLVMLLIMGLAMAGNFVVPTLLVEEKEKHTLDALLLSPARPGEVVAGKALAGLLYGLLIGGILLAINRGWAGNWPVTLLAVLLGALLAVAGGLLLGGVFHTTNQVNTWSTIVMLIFMAPSWTGFVSAPRAIETVSRLIPTYYLADALQISLAGQATLSRVGLDLAVLAGSTLLVLAAVAWTLRRERS